MEIKDTEKAWDTFFQTTLRPTLRRSTRSRPQYKKSRTNLDKVNKGISRTSHNNASANGYQLSGKHGKHDYTSCIARRV